MERQPTPPESPKKEEQDSSTEFIDRSNILPSMSSQDSDLQDDSLRPAPQAGQLSYAQLPGQSQPPSGLVQPQATYAQAEQSAPGTGAGAGGPSQPLGYPPHSAPSPPLPPPADFPPGQGPGTYQPPPPLSNPSAAFMQPGGMMPPPTGMMPPHTGMMPPPTGMMPPTGIPHGDTYPGYRPPLYGPSGQVYSYGASPPPPFPPAVPQPGFASPIPMGSGPEGTGPDSAYGLGWGAYPDYWPEYPPQQGQAGYGTGGFRGEPPRRGRQGRSYARNPGRPYSKGSRAAPRGANLYIFHVPNDMTNHEMLLMFRRYGNVLSVSIATERHTGRGKGYGFVSYDSAESAAEAIHFLNGYEIRGKRLLVQHKRNEKEAHGKEAHDPLPASFLRVPAQQSRPPRAQHEPRPPYPYQQSRRHGGAQGGGFVPVQEQARANPPDRRGREAIPPSGFAPMEGPAGMADHGPSSGFVPVQEPLEPPQPRRYGNIPPLPPIEALEGERAHNRQGAQEDTRESPLADLNDIGDALPDLPK